jgi:hypothetical protein
MSLRLPHAALLLALLAPSILTAGETSRVKCSINEDRVWVYDSPATLNVATKLRCGEVVTVLSRENGYIKVQTAAGTEGYVPDQNLPNAAPTPVAQANQPAPPSTLASAARAATAARSAPMSSNNSRATSSTSHVTAAAEHTAQPQPAKVNPTAATPQNMATQPPRPTPSQASGGFPKRSEAKPTQLAKPASPSVAPPAGDAAHVLAASATSSTPLAVKTNADRGVDPSAPIKAAAKPAVVRNISKNDADDEEAEDDSYLARPATESEDPACRLFFSGYGLSPGQFDWVVRNRRKEFPSVCPAASPSMVDYVIIFTHDADSYNYNMPEPVHTGGGFSDWSPIVQYDMNSVPRSEIDRSRREYVWVFHVRRGTYDPSKFSAHRRFQFSKTESKYARTVRDAFEFISTQAVNR